MQGTRAAIVALTFALVAALATPAQAAEPARGSASATEGGAKAVAAARCGALKRKARRSKRGTAKRRRYIRRYRRCRARVRRERRQQVQTPSGPAPSMPVPATPTLPAQPIYLPSYAPNPHGFRGGQGCQPGYEQTYRAAGYSCQYAGYNHYLLLPGGPVWTPVYLLFGVWYCTDGQLRFRC